VEASCQTSISNGGSVLKTLQIIAAIMALGLAEEAHAQVLRTQGWYLGLGLAPAWLDTDYHFTDDSSVSPKLDTAVQISGAIGYKFDGWRFEVEPFWVDSNTDTATVHGPLAINPLIAGPGTPVRNAVRIKGDIGLSGVLFNAAFDVPIDEHFLFTAGGGIGWVGVSPSESINDVTIADHDESAFAWQLIAGFIYALNSNFELQIDYRYAGISDTDHRSSIPVVNPLITTSAVLGLSERSTNLQAVMFGVRWYP